MEAFVLKLGENVRTSFIFSLANFEKSSPNAYVVITTKLQAICVISVAWKFLEIKLNTVGREILDSLYFRSLNFQLDLIFI